MSLLARHERSLIHDMRAILADSKNSHRSAAFGAVVLPQCIRIIEAIGHRLAYDAANHAHISQPILDLFLMSAISKDPSWYAENGVPQAIQARMQREAVSAAMPSLQAYVDGLGVDAFVFAPIVSDEGWETYESSLETFRPAEKFPTTAMNQTAASNGRLPARL
jgi:acyl-CoA oxidase